MTLAMTTSLYCLLIAVVLPYLLAGSSLYFRLKQFGTINTREPRQQAAELQGAGARVVAAQLNAWEALLVFAAALFVASISGVGTETVNQASLIFIAGRVLHGVFYIADNAPLRSLSFAVSFGSCISLFIAALF